MAIHFDVTYRVTGRDAKNPKLRDLLEGVTEKMLDWLYEDVESFRQAAKRETR
jgi:hypothetical protein